jgi:hypothetical protein
MDLLYTKEEKLKQVDDLQAETIQLNALINTYYEQIKHSESSIKSILETIPVEPNPVADRMLSLLDNRDGWTYDAPVINLTQGGNRRLHHEYYLLYRGKKESFRLHCGLISDVHTTCFLTYHKIIALKKDRETNAQQVFKDLDWKIIGRCVLLKNVSEGITKELDISGLTDEQIITELDKIELTLGLR